MYLGDVYEHPSLCSAQERLLEEAQKSFARDCASLHALYTCRIHKTLRVTLAIDAGVTNRVWDKSDIATLTAAQEAPVAKGGFEKGRRRSEQRDKNGSWTLGWRHRFWWLFYPKFAQRERGDLGRHRY